MLKELLNYLFFDKKIKILARNSCLGREVLKRLDLEYKIIPFVKTRVDYAVNSFFDKKILVKTKELYPHLKDKKLLSTYNDLENVFFKSPKPDMLYMDSFCELTASMFEHKDGWKMSTWHSHLEHSDDFDNIFCCKGLMPVNELEQKYFEFFTLVKKRYGNIPIVYLHFPTVFDEREEFKERGRILIEVLESLSKSFDNIHSITVEDEYVCQAEDNIPYHFTAKTFERFKEKLQKIDEIRQYSNLPMESKDISKWLVSHNEQKYIDNLSVKLKNKRCLIYGAGKVLTTILDDYSLSRLSISGVCDLLPPPL